MIFACEKCNGNTRMQVQATISAPGSLANQFSKKNLRRADVRLMGVNWETADFICEQCGHLMPGYGNYVSNLERKVKEIESNQTPGLHPTQLRALRRAIKRNLDSHWLELFDSAIGKNEVKP